MQTLKDFKNTLEKVKKDLLNLPIRHIEKEVSDSVQWASMRTYRAGTFLLKESMRLASIIKHFFISILEQMKPLKSWLYKGEKLLTYMVQVSVMLTSWLLLLTLVVVLYAVALPLVLSLIGLIAILTKLYPALIKLRTSIWKSFLNLKG